MISKKEKHSSSAEIDQLRKRLKNITVSWLELDYMSLHSMTFKGGQEHSFLRAGFHWRRSRKRSRKSAYDLVEIKNWSRKRSHKRDGIGVRGIRTFPFSSDSAYDSVAYVPLKQSCFH